MIKLIGIALVSSVLYCIVRKYTPEYAIIAETGAVMIVLFFAFPYITDVIDFFGEYASFSGVGNGYIEIILKAVGIAVLTQFTSDICRDSGQTALAGKIELGGKLIITVLAVPMAEALIEVAVSIIRAE